MDRLIRQIGFEFKELRGLWLIPIFLLGLMIWLSPDQPSGESERYVIMIYQLLSPLIVSLSVLYTAQKFYDRQTGELIQSFNPRHNQTKTEVLLFFSLFYTGCSLFALFLIAWRQSLMSSAVFIHSLLQHAVFILIGITGLKYSKDIVVGLFLVMAVLSVHVIGNVPLLLYTRPVMLFPSGYLDLNPLLLMILGGYSLVLGLINKLLPRYW